MIDGLTDTLAICGRVPGAAWSWPSLLAALAMWAVMLGAMMAPVVAPWLMAMARNPSGVQQMPGFLAGYGLIWVASGVAATVCQWSLATFGEVSAAQASDHPLAFAALFLAVGLYQWTSLKDACLRHCQSPMSFMLSHWRDGVTGALWMGMRHGLHCIGCCWPLMVLLLLAGAMSLPWMAAATVLALWEMYGPGGRVLARACGTLLVLAGLILLIQGAHT